MKKPFAILLGMMIALSCFAGCGASKNPTGADSSPEFEYMITMESTIESSRFGFEFKAEDGYAVLTDDMVMTFGDCAESDILTGESVKKGDTEYKLHKIAMATDFVNNEFITFSVQQLSAGTTLEDFYNSMVSASLGSEMTVSELTDAKVNGLDGKTFNIDQSYDDGSGTVSDHWNVIYIAQSGDYLLMVNCSATGAYPTGAVDTLTTQLHIS